MAKQLAMSTVVTWFGNLSFDQQKDALGQMHDQHEHSRSVKKAELETQLAALGYGAPKKRGRPRASTNGAPMERPTAHRRRKRAEAR